MTNRTALTRSADVRMTIRVYTVDRHGAVTGERATVDVTTDRETPPPFGGTYPPCGCPRHRAGKQVSR
ncbi:hypothetical protein [Streptomyces tagetis]|uniref:Uncharacterized protein n=1 Tax=Streptomyces tagetis TaxID=2820809 RepID=A0A941AZM1_9ACTN|nr:hypothetical protein [Streptomyces sp. RG38]MBQ0825596.1 hypothetical protein [Streptomyces sp. RG38]